MSSHQDDIHIKSSLKSMLKTDKDVVKQLCCIKDALSDPSGRQDIILKEIRDILKLKKDYESIVLCDVLTGNPIIVKYSFDDTGLLTILKTDVNNNLFSGQIGKCPNKNYGITSKEWFCLTNTQTNITREDIVDLDTNATITSLWRDELGTIIPAPTVGTFTVSVCILPVVCKPTISEAFGDDLTTLLSSTSFIITKPSCCKILMTTTTGSFTLRENETYYGTTEFLCPILISSVEIVSGTCNLNSIHIIGNNKGL